MAKRAWPRIDDDDDPDDVAPPPEYQAPPEPWQTDDCDAALAVRKILDAIEVAEIDTPTRFHLQGIIFRCDRWLKLGIPGCRPGLGQERVVFTLRCIVETGNESALCLPVVRAVDGPLRGTDKIAEALEVFDGIKLRETLEALRSLDLFEDDRELTGALERIITRKLRRALAPPEPVKQPSAKERIAVEKQARATATSRVVEQKIELGRKLVALRDATPSNQVFGHTVRQQFGLDDPNSVTEMMRVAKLYGARPEISRNLSWHALTELASSATSAAQRRKFEARIFAGERAPGAEIIRARYRACS